MEPTTDLVKEQEATLQRPPYPYSLLARFFFRSMDRLTGEQDSLAKARLIEALAPVPYHAWENHEYSRMSRRSADETTVRRARAIAGWGQHAKDNEYQHVTVLNEKLREDGLADPLYLRQPLPWLLVASWAVLQWVMSRVAIRRGILLNAEFEDHSEHVYAGLVRDNPQWQDQPVVSGIVQAYGSFDSWADVFRRIGLDERDHMNASFVFAGKPGQVVRYEGMPALPDTGTEH